ncbi:RNA-directed DNA polymerase (Reverse transcriptase), partial [Trifolium medium]|nr:RNA-directed DNA polymerase (Reverse transcriptase) [Trifolium medium]
MTQVIQTSEQQFYLAKLLRFSYEIVCKPGAQNKVADALSRNHDPPSQCLIITVPHWDFLQQLKNDLKNDASFQELLNNIQ